MSEFALAMKGTSSTFSAIGKEELESMSSSLHVYIEPGLEAGAFGSDEE